MVLFPLEIDVGRGASVRPNVQAFIRRASSMADKTSWTKPLARMTYGDSIVGEARLEAGTGGCGRCEGSRPPCSGVTALREVLDEDGRAVSGVAWPT